MNVPNTYQIEFFDSEQLQECVVDSKVAHKQVDKGRFEGILNRLIFPDIVIDRGKYNLRLQAEGVFPEQTVTLVVVHKSDNIGKAWGEEYKGGDLLIMQPGEEVALTIPGGSLWTSISIPERLIGEYNLHVFNNEIFSIQAKEFKEFNTRFNYHVSLFNTGIISHTLLQDIIISLFIQAIEQANNRIELTYKDTSLMALNIRDEILENIDEGLQMKNLCKLTGMSISTIERSFKQFFGMSPRDYHAYHRLHLIRQTLLHNKSTSVSNAAIKYGYMHLGRFSQQYKKVFGELPSQTLHGR